MKEFTVTAPIEGVASCVVEAESAAEAIEKAKSHEFTGDWEVEEYETRSDTGSPINTHMQYEFEAHEN